jgi:hypothetical protein
VLARNKKMSVMRRRQTQQKLNEEKGKWPYPEHILWPDVWRRRHLEDRLLGVSGKQR